MFSPLHHPCSPIYIKDRTNNKLNPHMTPGAGIEPRPHWWEASALTTASPLRHPCSPIHIKEGTNNKLNPHMTPGLGNEPRPHWWEASALTTAPPLLPNTHQGENQQQIQPTYMYDAGSGNRTQATLVGGERSHHCATPAPQYTSRREPTTNSTHI